MTVLPIIHYRTSYGGCLCLTCAHNADAEHYPNCFISWTLCHYQPSFIGEYHLSLKLKGFFVRQGWQPDAAPGQDQPNGWLCPSCASHIIDEPLLPFGPVRSIAAATAITSSNSVTSCISVSSASASASASKEQDNGD